MRRLCLFTVLVLMNVAANRDEPLKRHKRILHGREAPDRDSGYAVSRYMVWISDQNVCTGSRDPDDTTVSCEVSYRNERCGGALLTPFIVQTAGHCISEPGPYRGLGKPSPCIRYNPYHNFEHIFYVYAGWNVVAYFQKGYKPKQYVLNPKCANLNLRNATLNYWPFPVHHDYGLIVLRTYVSPYEGFEFQNFNYAPIYTIDNLEAMWRMAMSRELTCLTVGYGKADPEVKEHGSKMLRHGWVVIRNYLKCVRMMDLPLKNSYFNYLRDATWYCATPLPAHQDRVTGGDSGSPVTCDNEYIGLLSQTAIASSDATEKLVLIAALVFSLFENSEEYRVRMIKWMERFPSSEITRVDRPPLPTLNHFVDDFVQKSITPASLVPSKVAICVTLVLLNFFQFQPLV